jgi:poly(A) polymerase
MLRPYNSKLGFRPDCGKMLQSELTKTDTSKAMSLVSLDDRAALAVKRSPLIAQVFDLAAERNIPVYLVGGSVRDLLLAKETHDLDFAVAGNGLTLARHMADRLRGAYVAIDRQRKTGRVFLPPRDGIRFYLDFASLRGRDLDADLRDRDFTINAMALERTAGGDWRIIDPLGGRRDLASSTLRAASPFSFANDPVRTLRAVRMCTQFQCTIESQTKTRLRLAAPLLSRVSAERMRDEWFRILAQAGATDALRDLYQLGLLQTIAPQIVHLDGLQGPPPRRSDLLAHAFESVGALERLWATLEKAEQGALFIPKTLTALAPQVRQRYQAPICDERTYLAVLKCAVLLHDIGRAQTHAVAQDGQVHLRGYEGAGAEVVAQLARDWRCSNREGMLLHTAVAAHTRPIQLAAQPALTRKDVYRFFQDSGEYGVDAAFVALADRLATAEPHAQGIGWQRLVETVSELLAAYFWHREEAIDPPLWLSGHDLAARFGLSPGPRIGELLSRLREGQATGEIRTREEAMDRISMWVEEWKELGS